MWGSTFTRSDAVPRSLDHLDPDGRTPETRFHDEGAVETVAHHARAMPGTSKHGEGSAVPPPPRSGESQLVETQRRTGGVGAGVGNAGKVQCACRARPRPGRRDTRSPRRRSLGLALGPAPRRYEATAVADRKPQRLRLARDTFDEIRRLQGGVDLEEPSAVLDQ